MAVAISKTPFKTIYKWINISSQIPLKRLWCSRVVSVIYIFSWSRCNFWNILHGLNVIHLKLVLWAQNSCYRCLFESSIWETPLLQSMIALETLIYFHTELLHPVPLKVFACCTLPFRMSHLFYIRGYKESDMYDFISTTLVF